MRGLNVGEFASLASDLQVTDYTLTWTAVRADRVPGRRTDHAGVKVAGRNFLRSATVHCRGLWFLAKAASGSAGSLRVGPCLIPTLFDRPMRSFGPCALGCRDSFGTG